MIRHGVDFFRDEIRNGFYIPTAVKQSWAAALDVLSEIDRICKAHDIRYFADWGTILGAVRHGGFVPWDDDLDICMLRDDYEKFRAVCDAELPENFCIHDYERHQGHWLFLARVVNNKHIRFDDEHLLNNYNFPWLSGVDIFLKDYLYDDPEKEKDRDDKIMRLLAEAEGYVGHASGREKAIELYRQAEKIMGEVRSSDQVGQIFPWVLKGGQPEDYEWYKETVLLPFEDTLIPVPACYNQVLTRRYGDYNRIVKGAAGHDYPSFDGQRKAFESETGTALPRFKFDKNMLERPQELDRGHVARREVLFLPIGPIEWKSLESSFAKECVNPDTDVYVVPLPLMHKDFYGRIQMTDEEIIEAEHFEDYVRILEELEAGDNVYLTGFTDYDLAQHCPDRIYIQSPYDEWNPVLTVPEYYYARSLRMFTKELIYIPLGPVGEFIDDDLPDKLAMQFYVTMPGSVYADKVLVQSENIRGHYVDALTKFEIDGMSGDNEGIRRYWESRICVEEDLYGCTNDNSSDSSAVNVPKRMLFGISSYEYYEHKDIFEKALRSRLEIFKENADKVQVDILLYPSKKRDDIVRKIAIEFGIVVREDMDLMLDISNYSAYYGSSMPIIQEFIAQKKPVMVADYNI